MQDRFRCGFAAVSAANSGIQEREQPATKSAPRPARQSRREIAGAAMFQSGAVIIQSSFLCRWGDSRNRPQKKKLSSGIVDPFEECGDAMEDQVALGNPLKR